MKKKLGLILVVIGIHGFISGLLVGNNLINVEEEFQLYLLSLMIVIVIALFTRRKSNNE